MNKKIIGIDPGSRITGYGIIEASRNSYSLVCHGTITPSSKLAAEFRYKKIFEDLSILLDIHKPDALSVETQFVYKNVDSALKLGMARGVIVLAATLKNIPVFEYAPKKTKMAVTGSGSASKEQVQKMIELLLGEKVPSEDASDALAMAICHAHYGDRYV
ncbi:MAG: crossover junction endodeoxyribonuclease RuvC [Chlamydiae bacterium]|nr:crossover junction endodeoxyribonuclease RuvC [Chlamydiota bacterium]